jgi:ribosome-binding protein aMBF1 (putative translation factor)
MKNTIEYLEDAKEKLGVSSDYALAKKLEISRFAVSRYQAGQRVIDDMTATKIANVLGIDPFTVIAQANLEREKSEQGKKFWMDVLSRVATVAIALPYLRMIIDKVCILC